MITERYLSRDAQTRRTFVERCARAAFGLSVLPFLSGTQALAAEAAPATPMPTSGPGFGKAKRIIWLRLRGGMSHIDTFDPKTGGTKGPSAALSTKAGFQVTQYLPKTAEVADKICVIRSMTAKIGIHAPASYFMRTGFEQRGTIVHPAMGAWCQHYLGKSHQTLPSSAIVCGNAAHGNGFFPATFSPIPILDPNAGLQHAAPLGGMDALEKRLALSKELDHDFRQQFPDENVTAYNQFYDETLRLMRSSDLEAFDLKKEKPELREAYGKSSFGQGCLLARRLSEHGVRFIEVEQDGWDMHHQLETKMKDLGGQFDTAFAALLSDLDSKGLLSTTLVALTTEFGRKPAFEGDGRGHYPACFSTVLAGGGIKGGLVHGASDPEGAHPLENDMTVGEFHATIGWAAGLSLAEPVISPSGRPFTVGNKGKPRLELFA